MGHLGLAAPPSANLGEHPVGVTTIHVDDTVRKRNLTVEMWYPAAEASSAPAVVYEVNAMGMTVARVGSAAHAHRDVAPLRADGARPVVLYSHGRGSTRFGNVSLAEILASHGYIVAAPDHLGHTVEDNMQGISDEERAESALDRPLDLSRVLDELLRMSATPQSRFNGLIDANKVAVAGHSFGGLAALGLTGARFDSPRQEKECEAGQEDWRCAAAEVYGAKPYRYHDDRIKAALLISPAGFDLYRADGVAQVHTPTLVVGGRLDGNTNYDKFAKPTYESLGGPHYLLDLPKAGHLTATDLCQIIDSIGFLAKAFGGKDARDGCMRTDYTSRDALESLSTAALPFFDLYLNGDKGAEERLLAALAPPGRLPKPTLVAGDPKPGPQPN